MEYYIFFGSIALALFSMILIYIILKFPKGTNEITVEQSEKNNIKINKAFDDIEYFKERAKAGTLK